MKVQQLSMDREIHLKVLAKALPPMDIIDLHGLVTTGETRQRTRDLCGRDFESDIRSAIVAIRHCCGADGREQEQLASSASHPERKARGLQHWRLH